MTDLTPEGKDGDQRRVDPAILRQFWRAAAYVQILGAVGIGSFLVAAFASVTAGVVLYLAFVVAWPLAYIQCALLLRMGGKLTRFRTLVMVSLFAIIGTVPGLVVAWTLGAGWALPAAGVLAITGATVIGVAIGVEGRPAKAPALHS